jgi:hypothetical protein
MPPRRSARLEASAAAAAAAPTGAFSVLPTALLLSIFALLPANTRLLCAEVCRAWRVAVAERSLWTHLSLSPVSGVCPVTTTRRTATRLRGYAALARGQLQSLSTAYSILLWPDSLW